MSGARIDPLVAVVATGGVVVVGVWSRGAGIRISASSIISTSAPITSVILASWGTSTTTTSLITPEWGLATPPDRSDL